MKTSKYVCIFMYIIIIILFTVGYSSQSILSATQTITMPANADGTVTIMTATEVLNSNSLMISSNNNPGVDYSNINNISTIIFQTLFSICIIITILLSLGVLLSFLNKIFLSKIILLITLILMLIIFILLMIIYLSLTVTSIGTNSLMNFLANYINTFISQKIQNKKLPQEIPTDIAETLLNDIIPKNITPNINSVTRYDNGFILMTVATWLMFVNHIVYMFYI